MILTDVDGVLLDWFAGFRAYLVGLGIQVKSGDPDDWSMVGWAPLTSPEIQAHIATFNSSPAFGQLKPYLGAVEVLRKLWSSGHDIVAITSCSSDPEVIKLREENLRRAFGPIFKEVICLPLMESKVPSLQRFPESIWVEDSLHGAKAGVEAGHWTFILDKPYNQIASLPRVSRVNSWYEIHERFYSNSRA